jgi:hypothetical protein
MARYSIAGRASAAATATLPAVSLFAAAAVGGRIREIGIFNTTATAFALSLRRFSAAGTVGAGLTEIPQDASAVAASCTGFDAHTVTPTITAGVFRQATLPAAVGGGVIWTFGDSGLVIGVGTGNGYGILCPTGTGQVFDYYIDWDE